MATAASCGSQVAAGGSTGEGDAIFLGQRWGPPCQAAWGSGSSSEGSCGFHHSGPTYPAQNWHNCWQPVQVVPPLSGGAGVGLALIWRWWQRLTTGTGSVVWHFYDTSTGSPLVPQVLWGLGPQFVSMWRAFNRSLLFIPPAGLRSGPKSLGFLRNLGHDKRNDTVQNKFITK